MPKVKAENPHTFIRSETQLFDEAHYDVSLVSTHTSEHYPITSISDQKAPIEFFLQSNDVQFIDLAETKLYLKAQILKADNSNYAATDVVGTANNFLHSLFQQVSIYLNEVLVTPASNQYAYRGYLDTLLSYNKEFKKFQAQCALYFREKDPESTSVEVDDGFKSRFEVTKISKVFEMVGRPFCDLFMQNKYLIPWIAVRISFQRSAAAFCLMAAVATANPTIIITEARLILKRHTLLPSLINATLHSLEQDHHATYPMKRVEV